jgi:hypothetical protein
MSIKPSHEAFLITSHVAATVTPKETTATRAKVRIKRDAC